MVELDIWIEKVQRAEYLAEDELKALCEYVRLTCLARLPSSINFPRTRCYICLLTSTLLS